MERPEWLPQTIEEHETVVLTCDLEEYGLKQGDIGAIVHIHGDHEGYLVEFNSEYGTAAAIVSVVPSQVRYQDGDEILCVRKIEMTDRWL